MHSFITASLSIVVSLKALSHPWLVWVTFVGVLSWLCILTGLHPLWMYYFWPFSHALIGSQHPCVLVGSQHLFAYFWLCYLLYTYRLATPFSAYFWYFSLCPFLLRLCHTLIWYSLMGSIHSWQVSCLWLVLCGIPLTCHFTSLHLYCKRLECHSFSPCIILLHTVFMDGIGFPLPVVAPDWYHLVLYPMYCWLGIHFCPYFVYGCPW